ncbi:MAG: SRPBCC domain-containing protein [Thermoplasmata archaeon]|nr:SRPBCC domain-containing protein [Thermoplasmata archaeon]
MPAHRPKAASDSEEGGPEIVLSRVIHAPRETVWKAWTEPRRLANWWGPESFTNPVCDVEVRAGGAIRIEMRAPDGVVYPMTGTFREVSPPERLVFSSAALDAAGVPLFEVLNTVTFAERPGSTELTVRFQVVRRTGEAGPYLAGAKVGWTQSLARLATLVETNPEKGHVKR